MVTHRRHLLMLVLIAQFLCIGSLSGIPTSSEAGSQSPVRAIKVTFARSELQRFVENLEGFATENNLEIRVSKRTPDPNDVLIHMWRQDAKMLAVRIRNQNLDDFRYDIAIYRNGNQELPTVVVDQLLDALRDTVESLAHATVTDLK